MSKSKTKPSAPLTDPLRQAIIDSGLPMLRLAEETGIARASLIRFSRGDTSLRLDIADRLASYFDLILSKTDRRLDQQQKPRLSPRNASEV